MATENTREIVLDILLDVSRNGVYSHLAIRGKSTNYLTTVKKWYADEG